MMKQNNTALRDENILTLLSLNNLIVPEIQREYVWGLNESVLKKFLDDIKKNAEVCEVCHNVHGSRNLNVGFLYSYKPPYVELQNDRYLDEYLIDGQQRVTSVFLLLFYCAIKESRLEDFKAICRVEDKGGASCFTYKVRDLTQKFLADMIANAKNGDISCLSYASTGDYPSWLLSDYQHDPTVRSVLKAIKIIDEVFCPDPGYYFDYILHSIHFWHFKTEETSQGEELYITMNSRGEQLAGNEMKKAAILPTDKLLEWGQKWEEWQDFFWKHRGDNPDSDNGMDAYLSCCEGMLRFLRIQTDDQFDITYFEKLVNALIYVTSDNIKETVKQCYPKYSDWYDDFVAQIWTILNNVSNERWIVTRPDDADVKDARKQYNKASTTRNKALLMWPWMYYFLKQCKKQNTIDPKINNLLLIRLIRFYYTRFYCYKRSLTTIKSIVDVVVNISDDKFSLDGLTEKNKTNPGMDLVLEEEDGNNNKIISSEEKMLQDIFTSKDQKDRIDAESLIWKLQDHPYLKNGKEVGGDTFYAYLSDSDIVRDDHQLEDIENLKTRFEFLFDPGKYVADEDSCGERYNLLRKILLFYTDNAGNTYWELQSPWYYSNYKTSNWRKIVRSSCFLQMYKAFFNKFEKADEDNLTAFYEMKKKEFVSTLSEMDYQSPMDARRTIIIYNAVGCNVWDGKDSHVNVALYAFPKEKELRLFEKQSLVFRCRRYYESNKMVRLPADWQKILLQLNENITFKNYPEPEPVQSLISSESQDSAELPLEGINT